MNQQVNPALRLRLLIGAVGVILLGTSGVAAVMAWMPVTAAVSPAPTLAVSSGTDFIPELPDGDTRIRIKCAECATVAYTREIVKAGAGHDPKAPGGAAIRDGRNEKAGKSTRSYEVTVRLNDGSNRIFVHETTANWRPGERLILIAGADQADE